MADINVEGPETITSRDQQKTEHSVIECFKAFFLSNAANGGPQDITLDRDLHIQWLLRGLMQLPTNFAGLDASRPWFVFWISHALEMLGAFDEDRWASKVGSFLKHCQDPAGGFGGGPAQLPHLAPTYAATAALIIAGKEVSYSAADREKTYQFLMRMKSPSGGFMMHEEGETDMRGTYCAMATASMLHILTDELMEGVPEYVRRCQTFEGGIAGEEGLEAHGGYSYCGLAALCIIGKAGVLDLDLFLNWACKRQMALEGGFCGRTNKLVDSCYSFWLGAIFPLLYEAFLQRGEDASVVAMLPERHLWFTPSPLQVYVFLACQHRTGGLRDKPGKSADFYHTCYALSGVAAVQHGLEGPCVTGEPSNKLDRVDFYYNVLLEKSQRKCAYFEALPPLKIDGKEISVAEGSGVARARKRILESAKPDAE